MIEVEQTGEGDPLTFDVRVTKGSGETNHEVTMDASTYESLSGGADPETFVEACFEFLLDREPKESILASFDVTVIGRYFPEWEEEIGGYLER